MKKWAAEDAWIPIVKNAGIKLFTFFAFPSWETPDKRLPLRILFSKSFFFGNTQRKHHIFLQRRCPLPLRYFWVHEFLILKRWDTSPFPVPSHPIRMAYYLHDRQASEAKRCGFFHTKINTLQVKNHQKTSITFKWCIITYIYIYTVSWIYM